MALGRRRISEREFEDWLVANPEAIEEGMEIVGRQIELPHGRLDLLGFCRYAYVIELKAEPLRERDVAQVMRYVADVGQILGDIAMIKFRSLTMSGDPDNNGVKARVFERRLGWRHGLSASRDAGILAALVGTSAPDRVLATAFSSGVEVYTWESIEGGFALERRGLGRQVSLKPMPSWALRLSWMIEKQCRQEVEEEDYDANPHLVWYS